MSKKEKRAKSISRVMQHIWRWMGYNIDALLEFDPAPPLHIARGNIGRGKRNLGKPHFTGEFHPAFIRYLNTPDYIKSLSMLLRRVHAKDPDLYLFMVLRSQGYTYREMEETGLFRYKMWREKREPTGSAIKKNRKSIYLLMGLLPDSVLAGFSDGLVTEVRALAAKRQTGKTWFPCPRCEGQGCELCREGIVPKAIKNAYLRVTAAGEEWDFIQPDWKQKEKENGQSAGRDLDY